MNRVLFVDDEPAILEGFRQIFRRLPYEILVANSGSEALELLSRTRVDVMVSDEQMPGMKGSELVSIVCRKYPQVVRIILTGQASLTSAVRAINEGEIFRFLIKPCDSDDLAATIRCAIEVKELREQSSRLLAETRRRGSLLAEYERSHPGITRVERSTDGVIDLDADAADVGALLDEIRREIGPPHAKQS